MSTCILYRSTEYVYFRDMGHGVKGNDTLSEFLGYLVGFNCFVALGYFGHLWASIDGTPFADISATFRPLLSLRNLKKTGDEMGILPLSVCEL